MIADPNRGACLEACVCRMKAIGKWQASRALSFFRCNTQDAAYPLSCISMQFAGGKAKRRQPSAHHCSIGYCPECPGYRPLARGTYGKHM
jgi:hypothetical protein